MPQNYLDVEREQSSSTPGLANQISFSSVDYTVDDEDEVPQQTEPNQSPEQVSVISIPRNEEATTVSYCCALYDYEGDGDEELTFEEGQVIKVLRKCAHSVDDGWWHGELEGKVGNFPSLVVEECDEFGEPLTNQWDETPPCSAPPVFTPPEVPEFLVASTEVAAATEPAPIVEPNQVFPHPDEDTEPSPGTASQGFAMVLSKNHHEQYDAQFQKTNGEIPSKFQNFLHEPSSINKHFLSCLLSKQSIYLAS